MKTGDGTAPGDRHPGRRPGLRGGLGHLDVAGLLALRAGRHVERNALAFGQRAEALGLNCREVSEQVFATTVRGDEAETLGIIEPFDDASSHVLNLRNVFNGAEPRGRGESRRRGTNEGKGAVELRVLNRLNNDTT